jgi:hypothetical protein
MKGEKKRGEQNSKDDEEEINSIVRANDER